MSGRRLARARQSSSKIAALHESLRALRASPLWPASTRRDDELCDADRASALARGEVEVKVYSGLRHALLHEVDAAEVVRDVVAWLAKHMAR